MSRAGTRLVLLGLVCQGFSWDEFYLPWIYGAAGLLCTKLGERHAFTNQWVDAIGLIVGCLFGSIASKALGQSSHFFLGHGLAFVQLSRLLRPLSRRDQLFSFIIAFFHLGVAASIVLDYRFIPLFLLVLWLAPKALMDLEAAAFPAATNVVARPRVGLVSTLAIFVMAFGFFFFFPRVFLGPGGAVIGGGADQATLLDSILDPSRGGLAQSDRVLMQVEAENLRYLRLYALPKYEGGKWLPQENGNLSRIPDVRNPEELAQYPLRKVRVKSAANLGRILPTDGRVMALKGNFFRYPLLTPAGIIECQAMWNTANNHYEFRIHPRPEAQRMLPSVHALYTKLPEQSDRLKAWVASRTAGATNDIQRARALESYLSTNFTYRLGAPDLNRLNFVEDFIFNAREGHCERFAAALAHLLRMQNIPSRVIVGYAPSGRNPFTGWYNIRFRDAHAWTEAYFPELGWVTFDATPAGPGGSGGNGSWNVRDLLESLDTIWYSNFVNFDSGMQRNYLSLGVQAINTGAQWTFRHGRELLLVALVAAAVMSAPRWRRSRKPRQVTGRAASRVYAETQYGQMLKAVAKIGFERHPEQTPAEFLQTLSAADFELANEARIITEQFCQTRYGEIELSPEAQADSDRALKRIVAASSNRSRKASPLQSA